MKLLTCIVFHYKAERLSYLRQVLHNHQYLAPTVHSIVTTNTNDPSELAGIASVAPSTSGHYRFDIESFSQLPNPWLLPWAHKGVFAVRMKDSSYTHFMFSEDDIEVSPVNVEYWLRTREWLRPFGLYPSFFRVEWSEKASQWMSTDIANPVSIAGSFILRSVNGNYHYLNMPNPYQAMFFYDRELMEEHAASDTFDILKYGHIERIDNTPGGGGVAERANLALTFEKVPAGFISRNVVSYFEKYRLLDPHCFVHHLPNNYANLRNDLKFGKLPVKDVLCV